MKYIYPILAIGLMVSSFLCFIGVLKPNLQTTAGIATLALALYYGHRTFLAHHDITEIKDERHSSENIRR